MVGGRSCCIHASNRSCKGTSSWHSGILHPAYNLLPAPGYVDSAVCVMCALCTSDGSNHPPK